MAQSNHALTIVNAPVTEIGVNLADVYSELVYIGSEMKKIAPRQTEEEDRNKIIEFAARLTEAEHKNKINEFFVCEPLTFGANTDPLIAKQWIVGLENIFDCIGCSDEQKVSFAVLRLKGAALSWWMVSKRNMKADGVTVTWEKFKELFYKMYCPKWFEREKYMELSNLQQGYRTVAEYEAEFMKLSSFLVSDFVPNEAWEATQFDYGLRPEIRKLVFFENNNSYIKIRDMAMMVERLLKKQGVLK